MADQELVTGEGIEWTITQNEENNGEEVEAQEGPVFVAMQPGVDIPAGVEVQEVVIVAEGSETVQEVGQQIVTQTQHVALPVGAIEEIVQTPREPTKIRIKKRSIGQYVANNAFDGTSSLSMSFEASSMSMSKPSPFRGRPKGSKNTIFNRPPPIVRPPPVQIKQESQSSSDSSDDDSDDDEEDGPPRKKPKPREFAHRWPHCAIYICVK